MDVDTGKVVTFYSYKGGVGRTMALANVAVLLARWGYKVLIIDWDLEAPGLELYFSEEYVTIEEIRQKKGIIDLLYDLSDGTLQATEPSNWQGLLTKITLPKSLEKVHFLTAGKRSNNYFNRVRNLDIPSLYLDKEAAVFIENLRNEWKEAYDYILVDSRAGVADIEGVCTVQLPDILVMFCTANDQSLNGIIEVNKEVKKARQELPFNRFGLLSVPIPNRFDVSEEFEEGQDWLDRFSVELSDIYANWLPSQINSREFLEKTKLPYIPYFSFGEKLAVLERGATDQAGLGYAYETLAALIANNLEAVEQIIKNREEYVKSASIKAEIASTPYTLPAELNKKIVGFLHSLPNIHDSDSRQALILSAGLDAQLQAQINFAESPSQFSQLLVAKLASYGTLEDSRNALETLLESTKNYVGMDRKDHCDRLIQDLRGFREEVTKDHDVMHTMPPTDPTALRETYLNQLLETCGQVLLRGIDREVASQDTDAGLHLDAIYTALLTQSAEHSEHQQSERQKRQGRRLSVLAHLNRHKRLVLLGDPGSGKSTFVGFVTMCLAGELLCDRTTNLTLLTAPLPNEKGEDEDERQPWNHGPLLPVLVILRDFAARGLPPNGQPATAKHFWKFIARNLDDTMLGEYAPYLEQHFRLHGGLVLLDGLDEVPEADQSRTQIKQVVEDFAWSFPKCRMLVTSRTYAYQHQEWRLSGFAEAVIAPFTCGQIIRFVDRWYSHSAKARGMNTENARGQAEILKRSILTSERLRELAERPLLLTLIASLHYWRGGNLPEKREELYNDTVDLLLDWWESPKVVRDAEGRVIIAQESLTELLNEGKYPVRKVLERVAFQAHNAQSDLVGTADITEYDLIKELMDVSQNKDLRPKRLIDYLSNRAGLLIPRGVKIYTFPHRTFQEYLAACYLTGQDDYPDNVSELARQDPNRWREILLLAGAKAARGSASTIWSLAEALCYRNLDEPGNTAEDAWGALLAGQTLVETANLEQISNRHRSKINRIRDWLVAILIEQAPASAPFPAVERVLAGNILAVLGDPRPGVGLREDGLPDIAWCEVPAGLFTMGTDPKKDKGALSWEQPQHEVYLSAYQISRYPVTNAQYRAFIEDGGYTNKWCYCWTSEGWDWKEQEHISGPWTFGGGFELLNHPVVGVSWYEAVAFCNWLTVRLRETPSDSSQEGIIIRLPTEAEWEKAARGNDGRIYPGGNKIDPTRANYSEIGLGVTSAVGCFLRGITPYGCEDMAGNVWEWCQDWYDENYYSQGSGKNPLGPESGSDRVDRGGSWDDDVEGVRATNRDYDKPDGRYGVLGFRLVRTPS